MSLVSRYYLVKHWIHCPETKIHCFLKANVTIIYEDTSISRTSQELNNRNQ